jgi:histidine triad (HIT) family protein
VNSIGVSADGEKASEEIMAQSCIFCRIIQKEVKGRIVYEDQGIVAFEDVNPQAPVHVLVVPREHVASLSEIKEGKGFAGRLLWVAHRIAMDRGIAKSGYRTVINTGPAGGQTVDHLHLHLMGGRQMTWPPG